MTTLDYVVIAAHASSYPDPIRFSPGERVTLGRRDDRYPGWIRVTLRCGNEGWAPEALLRIDAAEGIALEDYTARELDTQVGERIRSVRELAGWVWAVNESGASGWIPKVTVSPISP